MLSIGGVCGFGSAVAAGVERPALHQPPPPQPHPQQLSAAIDTLLLDPFQVDEGSRLEIALQRYNVGDYRTALDHCNVLYIENPRNLDNLLLIGAIYYQLLDFDMCIAKNEEAIAIQPNLPECFDNMANAWRDKGNIDRAIQYYKHAIQLRPTFADAFSNLAHAYNRKGNLMEATKCFHQALALNPRLADAYCNLGDILKAQGSYGEAYNCYRDAVSITPTCASAWYNIAGIFVQWGDFNKAVLYYQEAIKFKPTFCDAHMNLGNLYKNVGMRQDAILCYLNAAQANPQNAIPYGNLGNIYYEQGQLDLAILSYRHAINCNPSCVETYNNMGNSLKDSGRNDEAFSCYQTCLALQPKHPQALTNLGNIYLESYYSYYWVISTLQQFSDNLQTTDGLVNRGNILKEAGRVSEAIRDCFQATTINPTMAGAHANLAYAYKEMGLMEAAIISYKQALQLRPDFPKLPVISCTLYSAYVIGMAEKFTEVVSIIRKQIKMSILPSVQPFHAMAFPIDPTLTLEISKKYAEHYSLIASRFGLPPFAYPARVSIRTNERTSRLRIGYVSSNFGNHPLSHLMGSVFGMHNQDTIEVFCYALSRDDGTEWRQRIKGEAEHFIDVSTISSDMIAKIINEDKIQILINLNGYTKGAQNEIFAMQPAPIQVSYMGFPSTTGANYIDYLITDEKNQDVLDPVCPYKRADYGLPEEKTIFACFNQLYKMDPDVFDTWCNILRRVPNSALWLLRFPAAGEMRLRACNIPPLLSRADSCACLRLTLHFLTHAISKGVRSDQIIFTEVAAKSEHIRCSALANLFLDTCIMGWPPNDYTSSGEDGNKSCKFTLSSYWSWG